MHGTAISKRCLLDLIFLEAHTLESSEYSCLAPNSIIVLYRGGYSVEIESYPSWIKSSPQTSKVLSYNHLQSFQSRLIPFHHGNWTEALSSGVSCRVWWHVDVWMGCWYVIISFFSVCGEGSYRDKDSRTFLSLIQTCECNKPTLLILSQAAWEGFFSPQSSNPPWV